MLGHHESVVQGLEARHIRVGAKGENGYFDATCLELLTCFVILLKKLNM